MDQLSLDLLQEAKHNRLARSFIRSYMGWPYRELDGEERDEMITILLMKEPTSDGSVVGSCFYEHDGKKYEYINNELGVIIREESTWEELGLE